MIIMNPVKTALILMMVVSVIVVSGCIGQNSGQNMGSGINIRYEVNPNIIYEKGQAVVYMDVENVDISAVDASIDIFNTGIFSYVDRDKCRTAFNGFLPKEIKSMECWLKAPDEIAKQTVGTNVDYKAVLSKQFSAPLSFDIIGQGMYIEQEKAGTLRYGERAHGFSDPNMAVSVEFTKQPPFVLREGEKVLMYVKIKSLGSGFLSDIEADDFEIILQNQADPNLYRQCDFAVGGDFGEKARDIFMGSPKKLIAIKGEFPSITCELNIAEVYSKLSGIEQKNYLRSFMLIIKYNYDYEIRGTIPLVVNK